MDALGDLSGALERRPDADEPELRRRPVLVLDCQATGASPSHGHLLELAWTVTTAQAVLEGRLAPGDTADIASSLVALPEGASLPPRVAQLTGITAGMLVDAPPLSRVWADLERVAGRLGDAAVPAVIHFARYEQPFLVAAHGAHAVKPGPLPLLPVCTHALAQRLLPGLPRRGLRAVAGFFGQGLPECKPASGHVSATAFVWAQLVRLLEEEHGVASLAALQAWLAAEPAAGARQRAAASPLWRLPRARRLALPEQPGVYRMLGRDGRVLYVGKATSLKKRVNSYFQKRRGGAQSTGELLSQVWDLAVWPTATPLEAALVEADAIKRLAPPYNVALRAGTRQLCWISSDLRVSTSPSAEHRLGPLPDGRMVRWLGAWLRWQARAREPGDTVGNADDDPETEALREGFGLLGVEGFASTLHAATRMLAERHAVERWGLASMLRVGRALWPSLRDSKEAEDEEALEEADEVAPDETVVGPETLASWLERMFAHLGRLLRRAAWLARLSEATIVWQEPAGSLVRVLATGQGVLVGRGSLSDGDAPPIPGGYWRRRAQRAGSFDVAAYDRLRVLTTELRRVAQHGGRLEVCFGPNARVGLVEVRTLLTWV